MTDEGEGWAWYASGDGGEFFMVGPCATREDAIAEAIADRLGETEDVDEETGEPAWFLCFEIAECRNRPVPLADWIGAERLLERADEEICDSDRRGSEFDDDTVFDVTPEQSADLISRIRRACDEWQAAHGLVFTVNTFEAMRKSETVKHRLPKEPANG